MRRIHRPERMERVPYIQIIDHGSFLKKPVSLITNYGRRDGSPKNDEPEGGREAGFNNDSPATFRYAYYYDG
jgi:hypothetical protein